MNTDRTADEAMRANAATANDRAALMAELKKVAKFMDDLNHRLDLLRGAVDAVDRKVTAMGQGLGL
jgi:ABC-type transporter Mla subunit MlaD